MCKELYKDGYTVVGNYHTKEKAEKWMAQMKSEGFNIELFYGDVSDYESTGKMIAEIVKLLVGPVFPVHDQRLMRWNIIGAPQVFKNRRHFRLKSRAQKLALDVLVLIVMPGDKIEGSLAVAGVQSLDLSHHQIPEKRPTRDQLVAKKRAVGRPGLN